MLEVKSLSASYGAVQALEGVTLTVPAAQIVCLLGANGAGKSTTLNCISGLVPALSGQILFDGEDITNVRADRIVGRGVVQIPEGREIFPQLSVKDNLVLGGWLQRRRGNAGADLDHVYGLFPILSKRMRQAAGTLSGGEQQMLMIGRALMARPRMMMFDEPSLGLSPVLVEQVFAIIKRIHEEGMPVLLVEQNARMALGVSGYGYVLENGEITRHGPAAQLADDPHVQQAYLGADEAASSSAAMQPQEMT
jgi:branched-chain amino acid transport system ATP-binding protein